jgi:type I restriction enzyme S subunit
MRFESAYPLVRLGNLVEFINGDRSSNYPGPEDYEDGGVPFISATDIHNGRIALSTVKRISRAAFARLRSGKVQRNDILLCIRGSLGKLGVVSDFNEGAIASSLVILRASDAALLRYLRCVLSSAAGLSALASLNNGSVQGNISVASLTHIEVPLPPRQQMEAVALLTGTLGDRIDLLRHTNATLESIAQALFKSWFIDFDPVRAKAEGREPEGMDAATAALFPTEFEESALGLIPKGWRVVSLKDCVQIRDGKPWLLENRTESSDVAVFGANGQVGFACSSLSQGRVLFVGKIGSCGALNSFNGRWWATNNVFYISKEFNPNLEWCRHTIEGIDFKGYIGGSSNPYMPLKNFGHHPVVLPSIEVRQAFEKTVQPFRERIEQNLKDASLVSDLRDTLLPRLISGKLRLPEAQEHVEEALA